MKRKKTQFLYLLLILIISLVGIILFQKRLIVFAAKINNAEPVAIQQPTIFVPGTNGTVERFNGLFKQLTDEQKAILKLTVKTDGTILTKGKLTSTNEHPLVVVAFEDSSNDTLSLQGKWFQLALNYLQKHYLFDSYNYVGHSNGGLVVTSYLENFRRSQDPTLNKLITIATPFNDTADEYNTFETTFTEVKKKSPLLSENLDKKENIPAAIQVLAIAGEADSTVPVTSAFSSRFIYQKQAAAYQELLIQGEDTSHSELVENKLVIQAIQQNLWSIRAKSS
ncbi:alpha/beta hydrolase [Erwinia sp. CPCC 100877]|nr:alpha/beta hydrolase [Erwinia sp. CPCC 100877]